MKLIGIMPVRNEAWCLGLTLRVALRWCDEVVVFKHACSDGTFDILCDIGREQPGRLWFPALSYLPEHASSDPAMMSADPTWREMEHRQAMLHSARNRCATHVALIDADEFLTGNLLASIRAQVANCSNGMLLELPGYNLREGIASWHQYHANGIWGNRWFATAFLDQPGAHWGGDRFHHREPMGVAWRRWRPIPQGNGGTLHLWGASERRLRAKHALYRVTERLRWPDKPAAEIERLYSLATTPREPWLFKSVPSEWLEPYADLMQYLDIDAEPWQVAEVKRLVKAYGVQTFHGLDLLGVPEW